MFKQNVLFSLILVFVMVSMMFSLSACQSSLRESPEEKKAKDELTSYMIALEGTSEGSLEERELLEKIISLGHIIKVFPNSPDAVLEYEGRAEAAIKGATSPADFLAGAEEYKKAVRLVPWSSANYYNLGLVLEKGENLSDAIAYYKLYLLAAPDAEDAVEIKKKIAGLEYEMTKIAQEKAAKEAQKKANEEFAYRLRGIWAPPEAKATYEGRNVSMKSFCRMRVEVSGNEVRATCIGVPAVTEDMRQTWYGNANVPFIDAKIVDAQGTSARLVGTKTSVAYDYQGAWASGSDNYNVKIVLDGYGYQFLEVYDNGTEVKWIQE